MAWSKTENWKRQRKKPQRPQNPQNDDLGKQSPGRARRAKCLAAFRMNIDVSINKRIGTTVQREPGFPLQATFIRCLSVLGWEWRTFELLGLVASGRKYILRS